MTGRPDSSFKRLLAVMYLIQGISQESGPDVGGSRIKRDLEKIQRMGFNTVYLFDIYRDPACGATYSPLWYPERFPMEMGPLSFDPDLQAGMEGEYEEVFKTAEDAGLGVVPAICYNLPVQWLWDNQDAAKRKPDGSLHYTVYYHECFRAEKVRDYTRGRLEQLLARYSHNDHFNAALSRLRVAGADAVVDDGGRPVFVIHTDTVDRGFCYCGSCLRAWRHDFLPRCYGSIRDFNRIHDVHYGSFDEVELPRTRGDDERLWNEFSVHFTEGILEWIHLVASTIRRYLPDALLSLVMKYPRFTAASQYPDWGKVVEGLDLLFMDPYPMEGGTTWDIRGYAYDLDTYRSLSMITGKPIIPQFQLSSSYAEIDMAPVRTPTKKEIVEQLYVAIGRGARGLVCWGFPPRLAGDGSPEAILGEDETIQAAAAINAEARRLFIASDGTEPTYGQVMLPYNCPSLRAGRVVLDELTHLYRHLSGMGISATPTFADFMPQMGSSPHRFDAAIGFLALGNVKKEHADGLAGWLEGGGRLLCGAHSFLRDENGNSTALRDFNEDIVGSIPVDEPAQGQLRILSERTYLPSPGDHPGSALGVALLPVSGEMVGSWEGTGNAAVVVRELGTGLVERIGLKGSPGKDDPVISALLEAFVNALPKGPVSVRCESMGQVDWTFRVGRSRLLIYLVNNDAKKVLVEVLVRKPQLGWGAGTSCAAWETLSRRPISCLPDGNEGLRLEVHMPEKASTSITVSAP